MLESQIEKLLVKEVKKRNGIALKITSPSMAGLPDRLVLLPKGRIIFVELKRPGGKPRPLQVAVHNTLFKLGFPVAVIDSQYGILKLLLEDMRCSDEI